MNEELLIPFEDFEIESYNEFTKRYSGFGKEIYLKLNEELPPATASVHACGII